MKTTANSSFIYDVFISYNHADYVFVQHLCERFKQDNIKYYLDKENILWGANIPNSIQKALSQSRHLLCVFSKKYLESAWTNIEMSSRQMQDPNGDFRSILPVIIEDDVVLPVLIRPLYSIYCNGVKALAYHYPFMLKSIKTLNYVVAYNDTAELMIDISDKNYLQPAKFIFVIGNPGAGKSTFSRELLKQVNAHFPTKTIKFYSDYPFLQILFRMDQGKTDRFRPDDTSEFEILDPQVYNEALELIYKQVIEKDFSDVAIIEFSRPEYDSSFIFYTLRALVNSAIVHIDVPVEICMERNEGRRKELEKRLKGAANNVDIFGDNPDLHYVPPFVYDRFRKDVLTNDEQALGLALMPSRGYFRIINTKDGYHEYKNYIHDLINVDIFPLISKKENLVHYYKRRLKSLSDFLKNL
ncbi:TIR domain-containing protein [Runella sp.]|uniref:TIR domain-containing protein n=1 Tax=Runella sp. TaxID=1960881 RepID=UPI003D0C3C79